MQKSNKSEFPFFSVIICTYNRVELISRALDSLINQTERDWECVIIDDGSDDDTKSVVEKYIQPDSRFCYYFQVNQGTGTARNHGIEKSCGKWITFLDSDDEYMPEHLASIRSEIEGNKGIEFFYGKANIIGSPYVPDLNNPDKLIHIDDCRVGGTFVINRSVIEKIGGFPALRFGEDYEFFNKAKQAGVEMKEMDKRTYLYYRDSGDTLCDVKY